MAGDSAGFLTGLNTTTLCSFMNKFGLLKFHLEILIVFLRINVNMLRIHMLCLKMNEYLEARSCGRAHHFINMCFSLNFLLIEVNFRSLNQQQPSKYSL